MHPSWLMLLGFAAGVATVAVAGPYHVDAGQVFVPGQAAGEIYLPGAAMGQVFVPGQVAGEVN